jgi:hypothetical protein
VFYSVLPGYFLVLAEYMHLHTLSYSLRQYISRIVVVVFKDDLALPWKIKKNGGVIRGFSGNYLALRKIKSKIEGPNNSA